MSENTSVQWKTITTNGNCCKGCGEKILKGDIMLHICYTRQGQTHICESCFLKAQEDYEEG